ncbi:MAG: signal peptidase II [Patescibacteria group bacterium]|nr:signal peptidase II [Patescibacteria group bacterium]
MAMFFITDRILKNTALKLGEGQIYPLIKNWLDFHYVPNPFIAFSIPVSGLILNILIITSILALAIYTAHLIIAKKSSNTFILLLFFILFGAISNLLDRVIYGFVIDYLDFRYFTILNLADIMISVPCIILIFKIYGNDRKNTK